MFFFVLVCILSSFQYNIYFIIVIVVYSKSSINSTLELIINNTVNRNSSIYNRNSSCNTNK